MFFVDSTSIKLEGKGKETAVSQLTRSGVFCSFIDFL